MTGFFQPTVTFELFTQLKKWQQFLKAEGLHFLLKLGSLSQAQGERNPVKTKVGWQKRGSASITETFFFPFLFFCWGGVDFIHSCWGLQQGFVPFVAKVEAGAMYIRKAVELVVMPLAAGRHIVQWLGEQRQTQMMLSLNHQNSDQREPLVFNLLSMLHNPQVISSPNFLMTKY